MISAARPLFHRKRKSLRDLVMSRKCPDSCTAAKQRRHSIKPSNQTGTGALAYPEIIEYRRGENWPHSALMFAAFMIGHHFSISAFRYAASASGVCCSGG